MGQEGYTDPFDPRYALVYMDTGPTNPLTKPSGLVGCSFLDSYNTVVGVFGTTGIMLRDDVMFSVIGPGCYLCVNWLMWLAHIWCFFQVN